MIIHEISPSFDKGNKNIDAALLNMNRITLVENLKKKKRLLDKLEKKSQLFLS
jgi:hypothetical protein